ncbi:MAG: hypothetical protein IT222_04010 [Crocinitomix sp.]|nr:hypothetical protein [Crocinitomix sp.]
MKHPFDSIRINPSTIFSFLLGSLLLGFTSCNSDTNADEKEDQKEDLEVPVDSASLVNSSTDLIPQVEIPETYTILNEALGDLDGDGIVEKVVVFDTDRLTAAGTEREMRIYVELDGIWSLWHTSVGPVMSSQDNKVGGDPFEKVEISNQKIMVYHHGGEADRWSYTHEYHLRDNEWKLANALLVNFKSCDYRENYTYDLVQLSGYHSRIKEECNKNGELINSEIESEETIVLFKKQQFPLMDGFKPGETEVKAQGGKAVYFY